MPPLQTSLPHGDKSQGKRFFRPKGSRLTSRAEYTACYAAGTRHLTRYFVVFVKKGESSAPRLGLAVTRKVGCAVQRNRIKRVLREFFRLHQYELPTMDIVVTPKRHIQADKVNLTLVRHDLLPLMRKLEGPWPPTQGQR